MRLRTIFATVAIVFCAGSIGHAATLVSVGKTPMQTKARTAAGASANPIVFVTQVPVTGPSTLSGAFGTHQSSMESAPRGGDLWIWYPDGSKRNLTQEAGLGMTGLQGANAIGVRDPQVNWDASKIVFSMVIGAPQQFSRPPYLWQLYEATGFQQGQTAHIVKVASQPAFNNIEPAYASDGGILFVSDRPRNGASWLYPQLDEYESQPTVSGVWKLEQSGMLWQMTDSPSGASRPSVDAYGRVVFTQWDHLQRDQQCDTAAGIAAHGCTNAASETQGAALGTASDVFPERRDAAVGNANAHTFNQFFPWSVNQDGTTHETINHIGAHELIDYFNKSFTDDPNLVDFTPGNRVNRNQVFNVLHIAVDPTTLGSYLGIDAPEFYTDGAGQIVSLLAPKGVAADTLKVGYVTPRSGSSFGSGTPPADFTGRFRNPQVLSDGRIVAAYTNSYDYDHGASANGAWAYAFRIRLLTPPARDAAGNITGFASLGTALTTGISKSVSWYDPDALRTYSGTLWELDPVEVAARPVPPITTTALESPETSAFAAAGVDPMEFKAWLVSKGLSVFVSRDVTSRDDADRQQPFNLKAGTHQTIGTGGKVYPVSYLQVFQGDAIRSETTVNNAATARRKIAQPLNDAAAVSANLPVAANAPKGSVPIAQDGSAAWFAPSRRSLTWQTTDAAGAPVVIERYWITGQPGEIRACDSCHGANTLNQAGQSAPQNAPAALTTLLAYWKQQNGGAQVCTNPQPPTTPACPGGGNQTGGTWQHAPFPGCAWTYVGGQCAPVQPDIRCPNWTQPTAPINSVRPQPRQPVICHAPYTVVQ